MRFTLIASTLLALAASASPLEVQERAEQVSFMKHHTLDTSQQDAWRLVKTSDSDAPRWANPDTLIAQGIGFIDVTDHIALPDNAVGVQSMNARHPVPQSLRRQDEVRGLIDGIDVERMRERLTHLTTFENRYYRSDTGVESAAWILQLLKSVVAQSGVDVTFETIEHSWPQPSIIARFEPKKAYKNSKAAPVVIVGAHQDTVRGGFMTNGRAPGADDDGSGTTTTLEAFTLLCANKFQPETYPVEFHWYSAEEVGLRGSQHVVEIYKRQKRPVMGMIQFDMTGFKSRDDVFGIVTDHVDPELTEFIRSLIDTYAQIKRIETNCNYGCSDHASWNRAGYRSAFAIEGPFKESSPYIHTSRDTVETISFDHMAEFVKLALGFAVELSA